MKKEQVLVEASFTRVEHQKMLLSPSENGISYSLRTGLFLGVLAEL